MGQISPLPIVANIPPAPVMAREQDAMGNGTRPMEASGADEHVTEDRSSDFHSTLSKAKGSRPKERTRPAEKNKKDEKERGKEVSDNTPLPISPGDGPKTRISFKAVKIHGKLKEVSNKRGLSGGIEIENLPSRLTKDKGKIKSALMKKNGKLNLSSLKEKALSPASRGETGKGRPFHGIDPSHGEIKGQHVLDILKKEFKEKGPLSQGKEKPGPDALKALPTLEAQKKDGGNTGENNLADKNNFMSDLQMSSNRVSTSQNTNQAQAPFPIRQDDVINQVEKAFVQMRSNNKSITLQLKPDILGKLRMNISTHHHEVVVKIFADTPMVKHIIEGNLDQLRANLQNQGLQADQFEVFVGGDQQQDIWDNGSFTGREEQDPNMGSSGEQSGDMDGLDRGNVPLTSLTEGMGMVNFFA